MEEISNYEQAAISLYENMKDSPVRGGFKKVCLASLDYISRVQNKKPLTNEKRKLAGDILTLGTDINNFYDVDYLDKEEYVRLRKEFKKNIPEKENDYLRYRRELSDLEKHRPVPSLYPELESKRLETIKKYRENVNRLSLAFAFSISFDKNLSDYYENYEQQPKEEKNVFEGFYNSVMAMQVVDDLIGKSGDLASDRPSFYTAVCTSEEIKSNIPTQDNKQIYQKMNNLFNDYYNKSKSYASKKLSPILNAVKFTQKVYPIITELARKHRSLESIAGINLLTWRDKDNL